MSLDPTKPLQQSKIPSGTVLFEKGDPANMLCLLHQGEVVAESGTSAGHKRLYALGAGSVPGFSSLLQQREHSIRYRLSKDSVVSAFPARGDFKAVILGKLNVGMMAVRSMLQENLQAYNAIKRSSSYISMLRKAGDNLSLIYYKANPNSSSEQLTDDGEVLDTVMLGVKYLSGEFQQRGGTLPEPVTAEWLQGDHGDILQKNYEYEPKFDLDELGFYRRILSLPVEMQSSIFKSDIQILSGLAIRLARCIDATAEELLDLYDSADEGLDLLCSGEYCFAEKFKLLSELLESNMVNLPAPEFDIVMRFLYQLVGTLLKNYPALTGSTYNDVSPAMDAVKSYVVQAQQDQGAKPAPTNQGQTSAGIDLEALRKEYAGSPGKLMNLAGTPADEAQRALNSLKTLRAMENPMDTSSDVRKLRRSIAATYWATYAKIFQKAQTATASLPRNAQMMLNFGFFDDEFLQDDQLASLHEINLNNEQSNPEYPMFTGFEWLQHVSEKKDLPSIDEMGLSFFDKLKHEHKDLGWKKETDVPEEYDNADTRTEYELKAFLETNVRLTSGSPASAFPILTRFQIVLPLDKSLVTRKRLSDALDKILGVDFSAFHREVLINDPDNDIIKEFVEKKVIPNFILVPSIGTKAMMWQDISGRSKSSTGRIAVPVFATADLFTLLLDAIGSFHWELTKTTMGPDWNNVSQPSITSDYTDYVQFFKKNRDLSPEIKEKLGSEFKRFRSDRDRFVNDYISWVKFESEGVLKLNKVARGIFYRHIPFAKNIRDNLSNQPAYSDIQNRFKNIRNRKLRELEIRYRKYGDILPEVLRNNVEFHKV